MIKLLFQRPYLSLTENENYELEDFSVLTGINGSGKTHLLKAISEGNFIADDIDKSSVIYYNYNDFNLIYSNISQDNNLKLKQELFLKKSSEFSNNLIQQRETALNSYNVWNESSPISIEILDITNIFYEAYDWSDEEIENFKKHQSTIEIVHSSHLHIPTLSSKQNSLIGHFTDNIKTVDIDKWLVDVKPFLIKHHFLTYLRNSGYYLEMINWDNSEVEKYETIIKENPDYIFEFSPAEMMYYDPNFDTNFINFKMYVESIPFLKNYEKEHGLLRIKEYFIEVYDDLKIHFKKNISSDYLNLVLKIHGEKNIFMPINVDNGFLNLQEIADEEKQFQISYIQHQFNQFLSSKENSINNYSDENFKKQYGSSPVELLNDVLNQYDINGYEFRQSKIQADFRNGAEKYNISISLYHKHDKYSTSLDYLSSGEKTLIALSFYLFKLQKNKVITSLLLLDEIDSSLHPSMSKRFLDVLYNIFYKKMGIKIIISTHSPSTVALAPDNSIFVMDKYSSPKILKVSKDKALKELTIGVPSFSVNYENRRQVFVESEYDANYYENLYNIYNDKLNPEISLNFISSGKTKINGNGIGIASCDQVISIVNTLREAGNNFSWGIIDWDLKNVSSEYIKILGGSQRYSIENYLLDPLLLAILLWKENILKSEDFGFEKNEVYFNILNFNQAQLQQIINKIISDLNTNRKNDDLSELENYTLYNGLTLQIPAWYCRTQGHSLEEDIIMKTYPQLESIRKKDESALKKAIINKVIFNFKNLVSVELINIFKSIQEE